MQLVQSVRVGKDGGYQAASLLQCLSKIQPLRNSKNLSILNGNNRLFWGVIIALLVLQSGLILKAQEIKFGVQTGLNLSNIHVTNKEEFTDENKVYSPVLLFNANGYIGFKSKSFWGLSIEPGYIQKGGLRKNQMVRSENVLYMPQDYKYLYSYIQLPVLLDLYFTKRLFFSVGPEFAYLINSKAKSKSFSFDLTDFHEKFEISGTIGLNYNLCKNIDMGLMYTHGITHSSLMLWKDEFGNTLGFSNQYNQYIQLKLRFKI